MVAMRGGKTARGGGGEEVVRFDSAAGVIVAGIVASGVGKDISVAAGAGAVSVGDATGAGNGVERLSSVLQAANNRIRRKEKKIARRFIL